MLAAVRTTTSGLWRPLSRATSRTMQVRAMSQTTVGSSPTEPSELWIKQREIFGGATQFGVSKYLKLRPKGPAVSSYHPEVEVRQLMFYTNENIETRLERLKVRRARGKGTPKKGSGKRAKMKR